jgi:hypothetical protein
LSPGASFRPVGLDQVPDDYRDMNEREALKVTVKPSVQQSRCPLWIIASDRRARGQLTAICAHHAARIDVKHTFRTAEAGGAMPEARALNNGLSRTSRSGGAAAHAPDIACARISS